MEPASDYYSYTVPPRVLLSTEFGISGQHGERTASVLLPASQGYALPLPRAEYRTQLPSSNYGMSYFPVRAVSSSVATSAGRGACDVHVLYTLTAQLWCFNEKSKCPPPPFLSLLFGPPSLT